MAELGIKWETVEQVSTAGGAVVTGDQEGNSEESDEPKLKWTDKPVIVYVCDEAVGCEGFDKLEEVVLKDEKLALGMKAFRTVKMHPDNVEADPLLEGKGKDVPRMLVIDPLKMKVKVLEKSKLKASTLYSTMKKVAGKFYKEKLDKVVKTHLKLLGKQDLLVGSEKVLADKIARLGEEGGRKAEKELEKVKKEREEVKTELKEIKDEQVKIWKLTPKHKTA